MPNTSRYWYKLWLQYDNNFFYLSPRASIYVEEPNDMETLTNNASSGCVGCGATPDRTFKFNVFFENDCSLASAWVLYNSLVAFINLACNKDLLLYRQVQDETPLVYKVTSSNIHMVDPQSQYSGSRKVLSMEVTFGLTVWPPVGVGLVKVGV